MILAFFVGGCSCSNEECTCPSDTPNTEETYTVINGSYSELYKQTTQSVVMVRIQKTTNRNDIASTGSGVVVF